MKSSSEKVKIEQNLARSDLGLKPLKPSKFRYCNRCAVKFTSMYEERTCKSCRKSNSDCASLQGCDVVYENDTTRNKGDKNG